jgi:hypothetical protein
VPSLPLLLLDRALGRRERRVEFAARDERLAQLAMLQGLFKQQRIAHST